MNYAVGNDYPESPLSPLSKTTESMVATGLPNDKKKYTILLVLRVGFRNGVGRGYRVFAALCCPLCVTPRTDFDGGRRTCRSEKIRREKQTRHVTDAVPPKKPSCRVVTVNKCRRNRTKMRGNNRRKRISAHTAAE